MKTYTILIADDYPENMQIIVKALENTDIPHKIIRATNGQILCEMAKKRIPDLIITDWEMPEMDGIEAIKHLKKDELTKEIPVIMCTGVMTTSVNLKMALEIGAVDFIRKPIDEIELQSRVNSMLKLSNSYRKIKEQNDTLEKQKEEIEVINEKISSINQELELTLYTLKETQTKLIQSEKMASIGILASGISHEINNPLNYIQGGITGIIEYFEENLTEHMANVEYYINVIHDGINRAVNIVSGLRHFSREGDFVSKKIDIHLIIDNCILLLQHKIKNKVKIIKDYTDIPFVMNGDEGKLHQAIINVLTNAVQSIKDKGSIKINTVLDNENLKISITDSGCGIKKEDLPKILDAFFTTKDPGKGTGLGLSIAYNILKEHDGTIEFESEIGKGTTVIIKLPLYNNENKK